MPVKERRTKILLLLFLTKDISFDFVQLDELLLELFDLSLNQKTKGTLSAMLKEGLIEKHDGTSENGSSYRMTDRGFHQLCLEFPAFRYMKEEWDGVWSYLLYTSRCV